MTEAQVLALIQQFIVANGNNEITANVLRPILEAMLQQPNDKIGDLPDLNTTDKTNIVAAINEVVNSGNSGFEIHAGSANPNITPPASWSIGDWYIRNGSSLYQYNGQEWVLLSSEQTFGQYVYIDGQRFNYTVGMGNSGNELEVGDIASSGVFSYNGGNFFGDLILVDASGDTSTGIGTKWEIINRTQI